MERYRILVESEDGVLVDRRVEGVIAIFSFSEPKDEAGVSQLRSMHAGFTSAYEAYGVLAWAMKNMEAWFVEGAESVEPFLSES